VAALVVVRLPATRPHADGGASMMRRIADGARVAAAEPGCRSAITLIGIVALIGSPFIALVPAMAIDGLGRGAGGYTLLLAAQGIGAVGAALVLAPMARVLGRRLVIGALVAFPVAVVGYGLAPSLWSAAVAIFVVGACYIGVLTGLNTVVQRRAPAEFRGRVLGLYMMVLGIIYPVGAVVEGAVAHAVGIRVVTVVSGIVLVALMVGIGVWHRQLFVDLGDSGSASRGPLVEPGTSARP
jgi:MFS family permease